MKESLLELLACPLCLAGELSLSVAERDAREVREGELSCGACGAQLRIRRGVVGALLAPHQKVIDEAEGWVRMLNIPEKQHEFNDEWILSLPFPRPDQSPDQEAVKVWNQVGRNFFKALDRVEWRGKRVLEIGAGRCWAVAELARRGALPVGLDILAHKYLGLETADVWFAAEEIYFERVLGDMHRLPFQDGSFDFVVTASSLHHTDTFNPVLREVVRVLRPDGRAFFINEPVIPDNHPKPDMSDSAEVQHNIIESRPTFSEWMKEFSRVDLYLEQIWIEDDMHVLLRKEPPPPPTFLPAPLAMLYPYWAKSRFLRQAAHHRLQIAREWLRGGALKRVQG